MSPFDATLFGLNFLDLVLAVMIVLTARGGYRSGLVTELAGWIGVVAGVILFAWLAPGMMSRFDAETSSTRFLIAVAILTVVVSLSSALAQQIGQRLTSAVHATPLRSVDRLAGLFGTVFVFGVILWLLLPVAAFVPGTVSAQVRASTVFSMLQRATPAPPDALAALGNLIEASRFPDVFMDLRPAPDTGPPPAGIAVSSEIVERATAATVRVTAVGCGGLFVGSGWTIGQGQIVTNAHVVAGADELTVRRPDGTTRGARVVQFDAARDLAVLEVEDLGLPALTLGPVVAGSDAVAIGYPGGQAAPRVAAVSVREQRSTVGRDIYREQSVNREVVFLAAQLRQGDSGSPIIDTRGRVVGVVFAVSPDRSTTAYALAPEELEAVLAGPKTNDSGRCL